MRNLRWYFDVISPFAYIGLRQLDALPADLRLELRPILFAGLLKHWGQLGPAEVAPKRVHTYRWCDWRARSLGIPFRFPAAHPFNPLPYLRLAHAAGATRPAIERIFAALWTTGADPADPALVAGLCAELGIDPVVLAEPACKDALQAATAEAIGEGVFGVPSFVFDGEVFWGADSQDFLCAFLADPALLRNAETRRLDALPVAAVRRQASPPPAAQR